jgi:hypothetical protein
MQEAHAGKHTGHCRTDMKNHNAYLVAPYGGNTSLREIHGELLYLAQK